MKEVVLLKNKSIQYLISSMLCLLSASLLNAQIKIGDNLTNVSPYSLLELESKERTLLIPRFSTLERDGAFDQDAPVGLIIFNTDTQRFEYYFQDENDGIKKWGSSGESQIYNQENRPDVGQSGDFYYDEVTHEFFAWNTITNQWERVGSDDRIIVGEGTPSAPTVNLEPENVELGTLYIDGRTGNIYSATDSDGSGTPDRWHRSGGGGGGGGDDLGNHIATQDLDLNDFSILDTGGDSGDTGQILRRARVGLEWSDFGISSGVGSPTASNPVNPNPGDIYVDESNGDLYTFEGTIWIRQPGVTISSGTGSPTIINPVNPKGGDIYVDISTGHVYAYNSTTNTWVNQRKVVSDDFGNFIIEGTDGLALLTSSTLSGALNTVTSTITNIVSSTLTSSTIQRLETTTVLEQNDATGLITYTDEDGGTASATVVSGDGLDPNNILTVGSDGGARLTSSTLSGALNTVTSTITNIVSSTLTSSTIQRLETTTVLEQNDTTGLITYTDEDGGTATANVVSGDGLDPNNILTVGSDGGARLTSSTLSGALNTVTSTITNIVSSTLTSSTIQRLETTTVLEQNDTTGLITYTDEDGATATANVVSGDGLDLNNILTVGSDGGSRLTSSTLNNALTNVSTVTITEIVSSTLTSSTIQALETTTTLTQRNADGVITYVNEDSNRTDVEVISTQTGNLIQAGNDGGAFINQSVINSATASETVTSISQNNSTGEITYTDEGGNTTSLTVVSGNGLDTNNILTVGSDGGSRLTSSTLNNALTNVSTVTITEIVSSTLVSSTIQALETTTTLAQNDTTGVITYINEDSDTTNVEVVSAQVSNLIRVGTDGGAFIDQSVINSAATSETITTLTQSNTTGVITYLNENSVTTVVDVVSAQVSNLIRVGTDGGAFIDQSVINSAATSQTLTSLTQDNATGVITYEDEQLNTTDVEVVSADLDNLLEVGSDGGSSLTSATLSMAIQTVSNTITQIVTTTLTSSTIQALETTTTLAQNDTTGVITYVNEDSTTSDVEVVSAQVSNLIRVGTDGGAFISQDVINSAATSQTLTSLTQDNATGVITYEDEQLNTTDVEVVSADLDNLLEVGSDGGSSLTSATLSMAIQTVSNTITQIVTTTLTSSTIQALETTTTLAQNDTTGVITYVNEDSTTSDVEVVSAQVSNLIRVGTDGGAFISQDVINSAATSQTLTSLTQDNATGVITYEDEQLNTTDVEVVSADLDNLLEVGSDGGSSLTSATLSVAIQTVSNTITQIVTTTLTSSTIQALETTTTFAQSNSSGVITYVDEDGSPFTANVVSGNGSNASNLIRVGTDGGAFIDQAVINSAATSQTLTSLTQDNATGVITYEDEQLNTTDVEVVSADLDNLLEVGSDGGSSLTSATLSVAIQTVSNTITQIVTTTLTSSTIQALETTTTLAQNDTTGVITYVNEDSTTSDVEVVSAQVSNLIRVGTDGGAFIDQSVINSAATSQTLTSLTQDNATGVITYEDEQLNTTDVEVVSADLDNLLEVGSDGGSSLTSATLSVAIQTVSNTITQIVTTTLTSSTIQALETTTVLGQNDATGLITYTDEDGGTTSANVVSGDGLDPNNILIVGSDGGSLLTSDTLSNAIRTVSNTITQIVTTTLTSSTIKALETTTVLTQSDTTGVITYVDEDSDTTNVEVTSADPDNFLLTGTDGGTKLNSNTLIVAIESVSSTIASITGDHLGNHIAEQNIDLGTYQLVGDSRNTGTSGTNGLSVATNGSVGINDTTPDASAALQVGYVSSNPQGMLIPKINLQSPTDATSIPSPANGLMVYNTSTIPNNGMRPGFYWNRGSKTNPEWVTPPPPGTKNKLVYTATTPNDLITVKQGSFEFRFNSQIAPANSWWPEIRVAPGEPDAKIYLQIEENYNNNYNYYYQTGFEVSSTFSHLTDPTNSGVTAGERNVAYFSHNSSVYEVTFMVMNANVSGFFTFIIYTEELMSN